MGGGGVVLVKLYGAHIVYDVINLRDELKRSFYLELYFRTFN